MKKGSGLFALTSLVFKEDTEKEIVPLDFEGLKSSPVSFFSQIFEVHKSYLELSVCN